MIVLLLLTAVGRWREPTGCRNHSTVVVGEEVYLWAGWQPGMPRVHNNAEKRALVSSVEVFNVNTGCWVQRTTRGTPPLGVVAYSCVAVRNDLYYFGGWCGHGGSDRYHNQSTYVLMPRWCLVPKFFNIIFWPLKIKHYASNIIAGLLS